MSHKDRYKKFIKRVINKILAQCGYTLERIPGAHGCSKGKNIFTKQEFCSLVSQMDRGDYNFDEVTQRKMMALWHKNPSAVPLPSITIATYASNNAVLMNSIEQMEITYQLPYALAYEETQELKYQAIIDLAKSHGVKFNGKVVADCGCGRGGLLTVLFTTQKPSRLYGIECASSAIDWINKNRPHIIGVVADIESSAEIFKAACNFQVDAVFCTAVLEHLRYPERALHNLLSLKKKDGFIIVAVPNGRTDTAFHHINFWSPESWRTFIEQAAPNHSVIIDVCPLYDNPGGLHNVAIIR
ncbi:MAG: class I SAM-dependent methyltransferase [bacterium]